MFAAVRIRGRVDTNHPTETTMQMLGLKRINSCVILDETPHNKGMLRKVNNWIAWSMIDDAAAKSLGAKEKKTILRLRPPKGGFKSIRVQHPKGDLGFRKNILELIERMK